MGRLVVSSKNVQQLLVETKGAGERPSEELLADCRSYGFRRGEISTTRGMRSHGAVDEERERDAEFGIRQARAQQCRMLELFRSVSC